VPASSNRSWRSLRNGKGMEKIYFLHVIKFLLSQKTYSLNLHWDLTGAQRISKIPDKMLCGPG